jgi:hypothetical protein
MLYPILSIEHFIPTKSFEFHKTFGTDGLFAMYDVNPRHIRASNILCPLSSVKRPLYPSCIFWASSQLTSAAAEISTVLRLAQEFFTYSDVAITGEGLQNLSLCSALKAFLQDGIFIMSHMECSGGFRGGPGPPFRSKFTI